MTAPDDYQAARYDHKAHRLIAFCKSGLEEDKKKQRVSLDASSWVALVEHLERFLLPGDLVRYAQEQPGIVLNRAMKLLDDAEWMERARAEAAAARKGGA